MGLRERLRSLMRRLADSFQVVDDLSLEDYHPSDPSGVTRIRTDAPGTIITGTTPIVADPIVDTTVDCPPPAPVPTCLWCLEALGDSAHPGMRQYHMECAVRMTAGSIAHLEERCSCYVKGSREDDPPNLSRREAALLSYKKIRERLVGPPN